MFQSASPIFTCAQKHTIHLRLRAKGCRLLRYTTDLLWINLLLIFFSQKTEVPRDSSRNNFDQNCTRRKVGGRHAAVFSTDKVQVHSGVPRRLHLAKNLCTLAQMNHKDWLKQESRALNTGVSQAHGLPAK